MSSCGAHYYKVYWLMVHDDDYMLGMMHHHGAVMSAYVMLLMD